MVRYDRYVYEPEIITAILDICPVMYLGLQDAQNPYVVPVSYGYAVTEEKLLFFIHSSKEGYKLRLIEKNPVVCCSFAAWNNFPDRPYKGHYHDFRSVMAFGKIRLLDLKAEPEEARRALMELFKKNHRSGCKNPKGIQAVNMYVIECDWADVSGKTETPVRKPEDVPMADVYQLPEDNEPYDERDLFETREDRIRNRRYLGYLRDDE